MDGLNKHARTQFNLEVPELPEAQQELDQLKRDLSRPVVLEVCSPLTQLQRVVPSTDGSCEPCVQVYLRPRTSQGSQAPGQPAAGTPATSHERSTQGTAR